MYKMHFNNIVKCVVDHVHKAMEMHTKQFRFLIIISIITSWACGVIMFTLLVGCPPFWHRKQMIMLRNIMEGKYSFMSPEWSDISGKCRYSIFPMMTQSFLFLNFYRGSQRFDSKMSRGRS